MHNSFQRNDYAVVTKHHEHTDPQFDVIPIPILKNNYASNTQKMPTRRPASPLDPHTENHAQPNTNADSVQPKQAYDCDMLRDAHGDRDEATPKIMVGLKRNTDGLGTNLSLSLSKSYIISLYAYELDVRC